MKFNKTLLTGAIALAALSGCGSSNKNDVAPLAANAGETPLVVAAPAPGTPVSTMNLSGRKLMVDGVLVDQINENTFMGYPLLAARVSETWRATKAVMTAEGNLEIYENDSLIFIINSPSTAPSIAYSRSAFSADSISWMLSSSEGEQGQSLHHGLLKFEFSECVVDQGQKEPDQAGKTPDQGGKTPDQGEKTPDQGEKNPDQGGKTPDQGEKNPDQGGKTPDQGQKNPEEQVCKHASVELAFLEVISKEPDQGQKEPDQGGKTPDQGGKTPDQGQKEPDQGGKTPDQGGKTPDQGEKNPDQGGKTPDQGGKTPDQGKQ